MTHAHFDHASPEDIARVLRPGTLVAGPAAALAGLPGSPVPLREGDCVVLAGARVTVLAAGDREGGFHPPGTGFGYLVEVPGLRLLHGGDTAVPPPALDPPADVIALPVSGGTVYDGAGAAAAAAASGATWALPLHWGDLQGGRADAETFAAALRALGGATVPLLPSPAAEPRGAIPRDL